jgi:HK97 family phage major capsid protein
MEATEIKTALEGIKTQVETKSTEQKAEVKAMIEGLEAKMKADTDASITELKSSLEAIQKHADNLDIKLQEKNTEVKAEGYNEVMTKAIKDNFDAIKNVSKGRNASMEVKVVGDMTVSANLTGASVATYQPGAALVPSQLINFADLVPTVNSATGTYVIYRETGGEGSISAQTPGVAKTQKDYDFTAVTFNAAYIAGYARYAKQMAQDLPFLASSLPTMLRRDYFKAENLNFYTALAAAATVSTSAKTVDVEQVIDDMGTLEATDYMVNGIVMNPKDWASIAMTKPNDYSLPGIVQFVNGKLTINGIPVYKASWIPVDKYLIGDWSYAKKVVVDGLAVEFFEQDADNVTKNLITARIESRTVLGIDMPAAFILGDFGNSSL